MKLRVTHWVDGKMRGMSCAADIGETAAMLHYFRSKFPAPGNYRIWRIEDAGRALEIGNVPAYYPHIHKEITP